MFGDPLLHRVKENVGANAIAIEERRVRRLRLVESIQSEVSLGTIFNGGGPARLDLQRLVVRLQRLIESTEFAQTKSELAVRLIERLLALDGAIEIGGRILE